MATLVIKSGIRLLAWVRECNSQWVSECVCVGPSTTRQLHHSVCNWQIVSADFYWPFLWAYKKSEVPNWNWKFIAGTAVVVEAVRLTPGPTGISHVTIVLWNFTKSFFFLVFFFFVHLQTQRIWRPNGRILFARVARHSIKFCARIVVPVFFFVFLYFPLFLWLMHCNRIKYSNC